MQNVALFCVFRVLFKWLLSLFHWTEEHCSLSVWFRFVLLLIFLISLSVNNFIVPFFFSLFALSVSKSRGLFSIMWLWKNFNLLLRPALEYLLSTLQVVYDLLYTYGACFWLFQEKQNFLSVLNDFPTGLADQNFFKTWHKTWSPSFCNEFKLNAFPLDLTRVVNNDGVLLLDKQPWSQALSSFPLVAGKGERAWERGFSTRNGRVCRERDWWWHKVNGKQSVWFF